MSGRTELMKPGLSLRSLSITIAMSGHATLVHSKIDARCNQEMNGDELPFMHVHERIARDLQTPRKPESGHQPNDFLPISPNVKRPFQQGGPIQI
jgi:hypothetical protein